jgi:serine/threonine-protein kinase HipA
MRGQDETEFAAYDLCYSPSGKWTNRHQLSLNGKRERFVLQDLLQIAEKQDIKNSKEITQQILDVVAQWAIYANKYSVNPEFIKTIQENLLLKL